MSTHEEDLEPAPLRRSKRKTSEENSKRKKKKKGKAPIEDVESTDDLTLKDAKLTVLQHFEYQRVDDIYSHIDAAIDQLGFVHGTSRFKKWKTYDYKKKVIKVANKINSSIN